MFFVFQSRFHFNAQVKCISIPLGISNILYIKEKQRNVLVVQFISKFFSEFFFDLFFLITFRPKNLPTCVYDRGIVMVLKYILQSNWDVYSPNRKKSVLIFFVFIKYISINGTICLFNAHHQDVLFIQLNKLWFSFNKCEQTKPLQYKYPAQMFQWNLLIKAQSAMFYNNINLLHSPVCVFISLSFFGTFFIYQTTLLWNAIIWNLFTNRGMPWIPLNCIEMGKIISWSSECSTQMLAMKLML